MESATADAFTRGWAHWRALGSLQPAIDAATMALLDGSSDTDVVALASAHPTTIWSEAGQLLASAHEALGLTYEAMTRDEVYATVLREELLRVRSGSQGLRRVVDWAYETIGAEAAGPLCERIVLLELLFEDAESAPRRLRAAERNAREEVDDFLARTQDLIPRWSARAACPS